MLYRRIIFYTSVNLKQTPVNNMATMMNFKKPFKRQGSQKKIKIYSNYSKKKIKKREFIHLRLLNYKTADLSH